MSQPYRIRPNKFVDREMFAEFVSAFVSKSSLDKYVYISMGGDHLCDHLAVYRRSGIRNLYAFDRDPDVVARQCFNAPFEGVQCDTHDSSELAVRLDKIVSDFKASNAIIWIDFTEPKRLKQLSEIENLVSKLSAGDVLRITMNADFATLSKREANLTDDQKKLPDPEKRAALIKIELGTYVPADIKKLDYTDMPAALAKSIARACRLGCEAAADDISPLPALITQYRDSSSMLTATIVMVDSAQQIDVPKAWPFTPSDWDSIEKIVTPELSPRERYTLDKFMHLDMDAITSNLGFPLQEDAVAAYAKYHRFYPAFQSVND